LKQQQLVSGKKDKIIPLAENLEYDKVEKNDKLSFADFFPLRQRCVITFSVVS